MPSDRVRDTYRRWRERLVWLAAGFVLAAVVLLWPRARPPEPPALAEAAPISGQRASAESVAAAESAASGIAGESPRHLGIVLSSEAVDVASEVEGRVETMHVRAGDLVRFAVPPEEAVALAAGTRVRIEIETLGLAVHGAVSHISPEVDSASHRVFVEAHVPPGAAARIPAGSVARVMIEPSPGSEP